MRDRDSSEYAFGGYVVGAHERVLRFAGQPVALAPKVVETLVPFLESPGRVISKRELIERIWPDSFVDDANLTQNVYVLRRMFEEHASGLRLENVPRRGYRLVSLEPSPAPGMPADALAVPPAVTVPAFGHVDRTGRWARLTARPAAVAATLLALSVILGCAGLYAFSRTRRPAATNRLGVVALQHYLLANDRLDTGAPGGLRESARLFAQVAHEAPESALGFAGLAESEASLAFFSVSTAERTRWEARALTHATRATRLEPDSAEAFAALGGARLSLQHDQAAAKEAFAIALRADPWNFHALMWDGTARMNQGRVEEARASFERALSIEPGSPGAVASLAWANFMARDYGTAVARSRELLRTHRFESLAWLTIANAEVARGNYTAALPALAFMERDTGTRTQAVALRAQIAALSGEARSARATLERLQAASDPSAFGSWDLLAIAAAYARLGQADDAFLWLDRVQRVDRGQLARDPRFDPLRTDRRFAAWVSV